MKKKKIEDLAALCIKYKVCFTYYPNRLFVNDYRCDGLVAIYDKNGDIYIGDPVKEMTYSFEDVRQHFKIIEKK